MKLWGNKIFLGFSFSTERSHVDRKEDVEKEFTTQRRHSGDSGFLEQNFQCRKLRSFEILLREEEFVTLWTFETTAAHHVRQGSREEDGGPAAVGLVQVVVPGSQLLQLLKDKGFKVFWQVSRDIHDISNTRPG